MTDIVLFNVANARDWVIIIMGLAVALFFLVAMVLTIVLGLLGRVLLRKSIETFDGEVKPFLNAAQQTATNVKGTSTYVSDAAVKPIIRTYGVFAGVRRTLSVIADLTNLGGDKPKA